MGGSDLNFYPSDSMDDYIAATQPLDELDIVNMDDSEVVYDMNLTNDFPHEHDFPNDRDFPAEEYPSENYQNTYAAPQQQSPATETLNLVLQELPNQSRQLLHLESQVRQLFSEPQEQLYNEIREGQATLRRQLEAELGAFHDTIRNVHMSPQELHLLGLLENELKIQLTQLDIYIKEIEFLQKPDEAPAMIALVISNHIFPAVLRQNKQLNPEDLVVRLLMGATVAINDITPVTATVHGLQRTTAADKQMVDLHVQQIDRESLVAKFPLHILEGTRKNDAYLRFEMQAKFTQMNGRTITTAVESGFSPSFVVMTNQKQWEDCERILMYRDAFGSQKEITWYHFANLLQRHFLKATKQDPNNPQRPLSSFDFAYLHSKFFQNAPIIYESMFASFWVWYGKTLQMLRYQRHICHMWLHGFIYGYMSREDVLAALMRQPTGTFVVRFSENHQGQFAVAYIHPEGDIRHYLVKPTDTAGAKITLPDFLHSLASLTHIHKFEPQAPTPTFTRVPKNEVLDTYYSKSLRGDPSGSGYDKMIA